MRLFVNVLWATSTITHRKIAWAKIEQTDSRKQYLLYAKKYIKLFAFFERHRAEVSVLVSRIHKSTKAEKVVNRGKNYCQDMFLFDLMIIIRFNIAPEWMFIFIIVTLFCFKANIYCLLLQASSQYSLLGRKKKKSVAWYIHWTVTWPWVKNDSYYLINF